MKMDRIKDALTHPGIGAGVPIGAGGVAEYCNNILPILSVISIIIGIAVGLLSLYLNLKKLQNNK
jgi:hypothetical protein